jgi:hypothetical protein
MTCASLPPLCLGLFLHLLLCLSDSSLCWPTLALASARCPQPLSSSCTTLLSVSSEVRLCLPAVAHRWVAQQPQVFLAPQSPFIAKMVYLRE